MKNVKWSTIAALALVALVIFVTWGALGGWSGMRPSMMGSVFDGMVLLGLVFIGFFALLFFWVVQNLGKRNSPTIICPNCGRHANVNRYTCPYCGIRL